MKIRPSRRFVAAALLAVGFVLTGSEPARGGLGPRSHRSSFYYSSPSSVLRGQLALERAGHLERGKYEPGRYDPPTREAIRDFQHRHQLWSSGRFDRDTYALLPVDDRPDEDGDGIPDADDRCPKTTKGSQVVFDGCPRPDDATSSSPADSDAGND